MLRGKKKQKYNSSMEKKKGKKTYTKSQYQMPMLTSVDKNNPNGK